MVDNRRNSSSGIIILFLIFVFFSFLHEEKERQITKTTTQSSVISNTNSSDQAIIGPTISAPGLNLFWTSTLNAKFAFVDCTSSREFIFNNLVSSSFSSCQLKFHFRNPIISLFFLQKVPEQGKEEDILSIT
jgi:hypothetical protein